MIFFFIVDQITKYKIQSLEMSAQSLEISYVGSGVVVINGVEYNIEGDTLFTKRLL